MISTTFPDELIVTDGRVVNGTTTFKLKKSFRFISSIGEITVPKGFITDGASIPRIFWSILSPYGEYFSAAIIHDYLYTKKNDVFTRDESDMIFNEAMRDIGVNWFKRQLIYLAVRTFGGAAFHKK